MKKKITNIHRKSKWTLEYIYTHTEKYKYTVCINIHEFFVLFLPFANSENGLWLKPSMSLVTFKSLL